MASTSVPIGRRAAAPTGKPPGLWKRVRRNIWGYIFVSPWVLLYLIFGIYPLVLSFYLTFFTYSFVRPQDLAFVGLGNWIRGIQDPLFWQSLFNNSYNQVIFILLKNGLGLATALLLKQATRGARIFRTLYFMPVVTSVVVLMTVGVYLVGPTGPIQNLLLRTGLVHAPVFWKFNFWLPMPVIALINSWKWFGISTVILLAGLYGIDPLFYEAASLDGASAWDRFRHITLPQLSPQLFFLLVVDVINGLQMFTEVYTQFDLYGGPNHQALTPVLYLYAQAFDRANMGTASTYGLMLAVIIALITVFQFRIFPRDES